MEKKASKKIISLNEIIDESSQQQVEQEISLDSIKDLDGNYSDIYKEITKMYLEMKCPWVIGFSGGKDSTTILQMVWYALKQLPPEKRKYPIFVIASDTLVENPTISIRLINLITEINLSAKKNELPLTAEIAYPDIKESFWVNLIGKGYPAPSQQFRWCTDRMKIRPINRAIEAKLLESGRIIIVLGTRKAESSSRSQSIEKSKKKSSYGTHFGSHPYLQEAYVFTPIEDLSDDDVWEYLVTTQAPWNPIKTESTSKEERKNDNQILYDLYRDASGGECPLVMTADTEPCGGSRFGCWTCTLVKRDKTADTLLQNGQTWLKPLIDIRNKLTKTQNPEEKEKVRDYKRRTGYVNFNRSDEGKVVPGPYLIEFRKEVLRDVLKAQIEIAKDSPYPELKLIRIEELNEIRRLWRIEEGDWEDSVSEIYQEVYNEKLDKLEEDLDIFTKKEKELLLKICEEEGVPIKLVIRLLEQERLMSPMIKRNNLKNTLKSIFKEEWRPLEVVMEQHQDFLDKRLE